MNQWGFYRSERLLEGSEINNNSGQLPHQAKYLHHFVNTNTGEFRKVSDLDIKKNKRNRLIDSFCRRYYDLYLDETISILTFVVDPDKYITISKFVNTISRKLKRKGIKIYGYIWARDIGDIRFEKHYHIIISISRIESKLFDVLFNFFGKKRKEEECKKRGYKVEFMKTRWGLYTYLKNKELFGKRNQRSYGRSRRFERPMAASPSFSFQTH